MIDIIRRWLGFRDEEAGPPPPRPSDWSLTLDQWMEEVRSGRRRCRSRWESIWAEEYERSLLPPDTRFPFFGDVYEALEDVSIHLQIDSQGPASGDIQGTLPKGTRIRIHTRQAKTAPLAEYAIPVEYEVLERQLIPPAVKNGRGYGGYSLGVRTLELNTRFRLVEDGSTAGHHIDPS